MQRLASILILTAVLALPLDARGSGLFPDLTVNTGLTPARAEYLGISTPAVSFRLSDIKARYLFVNVFSLYCAPCQKDAPRLNEMFHMAQRAGLGDEVKFLGIAAGNTQREVELWREKFAPPFPLVRDEDYAMHAAIGGVGTPFFALARIDGPDRLTLLLAREGAFDDPEVFFREMLDLMGHSVAADR